MSAKALLLAGMIATVGDDPGGLIRDYYFNMVDKLHGGFTMRFSGECKSACTLYLAVPNKCVMPNASFHFHSPWGAPAEVIQRGKNFLMAVYPQWVRDWIIENDGLGSLHYKMMPHSYVLKFVEPCKVYVSDNKG